MASPQLQPRAPVAGGMADSSRPAAVNQGYSLASSWEHNAPLSERQLATIAMLANVAGNRSLPPHLVRLVSGPARSIVYAPCVSPLTPRWSFTLHMPCPTPPQCNHHLACLPARPSLFSLPHNFSLLSVTAAGFDASYNSPFPSLPLRHSCSPASSSPPPPFFPPFHPPNFPPLYTALGIRKGWKEGREESAATAAGAVVGEGGADDGEEGEEESDMLLLVNSHQVTLSPRLVLVFPSHPSLAHPAVSPPTHYWRVASFPQFYKWHSDLETAMKSETEEKYRQYVSVLETHLQTCDHILMQVTGG
ncbi:unnamed protein product [Closterium sp. Yama58-4]|nr:unnamed protein product [Closterium sp. Yama58-4]